MDYLIEGVALGIDSVILLTCIRQYYKKKKTMGMIASAPVLAIDKDLKKQIISLPDQKLPYVALRGSVKPLGNAIISNNNPNVSGVIQTLKIKEHVVQRSSTGFWSDSERTIQEVHNVMPFALESKGTAVEITEPLLAEYLDMDVISDTFHPSVPSVFDHIWGFFMGVRQRGIQTTEKMLRKGTVLTAIGELVYDHDKTLKLHPPTQNDASFYLTSMPIAALLKKIEMSKNNYAILCVIFGLIGGVISGILIRKYLKHKKQLKEEEKKKNKLDETRKNRRKLTRSMETFKDNQLCVVCKSNPIEIILLPCGHVCLCEDCADDITSLCPICRASIGTKSAAYIL